jgi:WD40 repeat protein
VPLEGLFARLMRWFNPSRTRPNGYQFNGLVAFGVIDGAPIIVSGGEDGTICRWDARTSRSIGRPLKGTGWASVTSLEFGVIDSVPVIVSGSDDNTIRRWDARRGQPIGKPLEGHTGIKSPRSSSA